MHIVDHHALLFIADFTEVKSDFITSLQNLLSTPFQGNPDIFFREYGRLGIEDAHDIRALNNSSPVAETKKHVVVSFYDITREAQNALLKVVEEPNQNIRFYFFTPSKDSLLRTLLSRLSIQHSFEQKAKEFFFDPKKFSVLSKKEKLALVDGWVSELSKETLSKEEVCNFLIALRKELQLALSKKQSKDLLSQIEALDTALVYARDTGASYKQLLSLIALS